jgi:hypothetical protein
MSSYKDHKPGKFNISDVSKGCYSLDEINPQSLDGLEYEAFDPGHTFLYQGNKGTKLSRKEWKQSIGITKLTKKVINRNKRIKTINDELTEFTMKSCDKEILKSSIKKYGIHWNALWKHYGDAWWGRERFHSSIQKEKTLAKIANKLLGNNRKKIAVFGNAVFNSTMKGLPPAPVKAVRDYVARFGRVILVDEYLTSKMCSCGCKEQMVRHAKIHGIFHCKNGCRKTWNRDVNASINIDKIFVAHMSGNDRPLTMRRPKPVDIALMQDSVGSTLLQPTDK